VGLSKLVARELDRLLAAFCGTAKPIAAFLASPARLPAPAGTDHAFLACVIRRSGVMADARKILRCAVSKCVHDQIGAPKAIKPPFNFHGLSKPRRAGTTACLIQSGSSAGRDRAKCSLCAVVRACRCHRRLCRHLSFLFCLNPASVRHASASPSIERVGNSAAAVQRRVPWLEEFTAELLAFPGRHDDQVDALTQGLAWGRVRRGEASASPVRGMYRPKPSNDRASTASILRLF
jgi:hypothetical protein